LPYDRNNPEKPFEMVGTWCTYEAGIPIAEEEYLEVFKKATSKKEFTII